MAYLTLKNINKIYPNGYHAVHDFNLEIEKGEFIVFVGSSGCVVGGLLPRGTRLVRSRADAMAKQETIIPIIRRTAKTRFIMVCFMLMIFFQFSIRICAAAIYGLQ